jgi:hypothetical protein
VRVFGTHSYGRSAADMTPLDAARLIVAVLGSTFARESEVTLKKFCKLVPHRANVREATLEEFLAMRIGRLPFERHFPESHKFNPRAWGRSRRLTRVALELMWIAGEVGLDMSAFAVVRWLRADGGKEAMAFASDRQKPPVFDQYDLAEHYPQARIVQVRTVMTEAMVDIAEALLPRRGAV